MPVNILDSLASPVLSKSEYTDTFRLPVGPVLNWIKTFSIILILTWNVSDVIWRHAWSVVRMEQSCAPDVCSFD